MGFVGLVHPVSMKLGIEWEARMKTAYRRKMHPMSWQHNWVLGEFHSQFWICIACGFTTYFSYTPLNGALSELHPVNLLHWYPVSWNSTQFCPLYNYTWMGHAQLNIYTLVCNLVFHKQYGIGVFIYTSSKR
jgi:hypothetical protein